MERAPTPRPATKRPAKVDQLGFDSKRKTRRDDAP
jgi:hypothetical protein